MNWTWRKINCSVIKANHKPKILIKNITLNKREKNWTKLKSIRWISQWN